jgi:Family of unknown function (DUF6442)
MTTLVPRDERETAIDHAADRLSFIVMAYGLLVIVALRGLNGEASWDLLGLVVVGGAVGLAYRLQKRAVSQRFAIVIVATMLAASLVAAILASQLPR